MSGPTIATVGRGEVGDRTEKAGKVVGNIIDLAVKAIVTIAALKIIFFM